ncbi:MAG: helix-turn-helix transcriptional regulator [Actinobacteria bacterium]|nr:helix-turn-helix transcriptional regulator [Actinomycetota bacterium]
MAKAPKPDVPAPTPAARTLAEKIDHLFTAVRPAKGEYTHEQVAKAIEDAGGPTISATYLWQLRKGMRDNPTKKHLEALSGFFGVPPAYFFDDEAAAAVDAELALLTALRDPKVRELATRAAGLSPETLSTLIDMTSRARQLEGLADPLTP